MRQEIVRILEITGGLSEIVPFDSLLRADDKGTEEIKEHSDLLVEPVCITITPLISTSSDNRDFKK